MTTFDRHTATVYVGATQVSPTECGVRMDRGWAPYVQGTIRAPMALGIDPRTSDRVRVDLLQVFGESMLASEVSAAHPGVLASTMSALWAGMTAAEVSALHFTPWNTFGVRSSTARSLDLTVVNTETDLRAAETIIEVASDEALAQGHILVQTIPITFGTTSVRSVVSQVLGRIGAVLQAGAADGTLDEVPTWEPGTSAWAFLAPLVQQAGLRLWCDGRRAWRLDVDDAEPVGLLELSSTDTLADATLGIDVERGGWADAVVIRYRWRDSLGVDRVKYDVAGKNHPRQGLFIEYDDTVYPGPGAAAEVLRRRQDRGHDAPVDAVSDYTAEPGQALTLSFIRAGFTREGVVQAVEWRIPAGEMSVTPAALVEGAPPPVPDTTPPTPGTVAGSSVTDTSFDLTITGAADETALHAQPYAFSTDNGGSWTLYQASNVYAAAGLTASTGYTCKGRVRDAAGNTATTPGVVVTTDVTPITGTYQTTAYNESDLSTYTFAAQPIGSESALRRVVVAVGCRHTAGRTIDSVTIGGVSATIDGSKSEASDLNEVAIASAVVPTGATADVVVTFAGGVAVRCAIGVWSLSHGSPVANATAAESDPTSLTLATNVGDFVLGTVSAQATGADWAGAIERYDTAATGSSRYSSADTVAVGASTVIDLDPTGTPSQIAACGVVYRA